ncbi:hypothetical protein ACLBV4_28065, partial [Pseudomonas aeruginosa]|nr:hypothetical protein [Pseudomonas aeruginosa]
IHQITARTMPTFLHGLGQYLTPTHDMMYSVLYRFTSVCFAVLITLMTVLVIHLFLNRFAATRHYSH